MNGYNHGALVAVIGHVNSQMKGTEIKHHLHPLPWMTYLTSAPPTAFILASSISSVDLTSRRITPVALLLLPPPGRLRFLVVQQH